MSQFLRREDIIEEMCEKNSTRGSIDNFLNKQICNKSDIQKSFPIIASAVAPSDVTNHEDLVISIVNRDYSTIKKLLLKGEANMDPNLEISFNTVYMTALEYSIFVKDWKMAVLFFMNGADPMYNCFDGFGFSDGSNPKRICTHKSFKTGGSQTIPGFEGLYCLARQGRDHASDHGTNDQEEKQQYEEWQFQRDHSEKILFAFLWLMEVNYDKNEAITVERDLARVKNALILLSHHPEMMNDQFVLISTSAMNYLEGELQNPASIVSREDLNDTLCDFTLFLLRHIVIQC